MNPSVSLAPSDVPGGHGEHEGMMPREVDSTVEQPNTRTAERFSISVVRILT
jgi:hypothetical protein